MMQGVEGISPVWDPLCADVAGKTAAYVYIMLNRR